MEALPDRSDTVTIVLVARIPGTTWSDQDAATTDPATLAAHLGQADVLFGAVERGISTAAIDAGAHAATTA
ncbi:hypothetical protein [Micromonospora aurantiaca (nom. illeg.)]|uniref:hypothetical protein n=1 Tax=Micromonospora aurantiaca (nom. illeg.) TaxID=47850 RepID=UPI00119ECFDC|nr:hypothetical protein [Micromonospora aurantiaca]MBC9005156.1 hypothetical protein [Micromonospora aurantiaca]